MKIKNLHMFKDTSVENYRSSLVKTTPPATKTKKTDKSKPPVKKKKLKIQSDPVLEAVEQDRKLDSIVPPPAIVPKELANKQQQQESDAEGEEEEEEAVFSDCYRVRSKSLKCAELVSTVVLPKYAFAPSLKKQNGSQGAKGLVMLEVMGGIDPKRKINAYTDILKAARDGLKDFFIDLLDENDQPLMTIELIEPRIHAIDFGSFEMEREEVRTIKVEIDYEILMIDNQSL